MSTWTQKKTYHTTWQASPTYLGKEVNMRKIAHGVYVVLFYPACRIENDTVRRALITIACVRAAYVFKATYTEAKEAAEYEASLDSLIRY